MSFIRQGYLTGATIGLLWAFVVAITVTVVMSFSTGESFRPGGLGCLILGVLGGLAAVQLKNQHAVAGGFALISTIFMFVPFSPILVGDTVSVSKIILAGVLFALATIYPLAKMLQEIEPGALDRHSFEESIIRFLTGFGYVVFTAIVLIPFYVMVMTSLKSQQALLQNPLDFTIDFSRGLGLFRSYIELFADFNFGSLLFTSLYVSVCTVFITLLFAVPGAYAVARLRFRGQAAFSRSILLIYMVPLIVLALPIYIAFSVTGLRNTIVGLLLIYPVTTIPVALYMLQGYFRGLPGEVEEAGLMDGLSRLQVIWKITLPLSLPALVSVSLYVFMIAWNEFLLAFMLLDDPSKFTLTRGVAALNSSEIPRQHLMAGAVIATVPIMVLFLTLERFMTKGLTAGSVKG